MSFDKFVSKILKENLINAPSRNVPSAYNSPKKEEKTEQPTKKISDIGNPQASSQKNTNQSQNETPPSFQSPSQDKNNEEGPESSVESLVSQLSNNQQKEDINAKKLHDDFAKLIATLTNMQKIQNQQQNKTDNEVTNSTNPQDIISALKKI